MLGTILIVILILFLLGALPTWPHSRSWGYGPSGGAGLGCGRSARLGAHGTPLIRQTESAKEKPAVRAANLRLGGFVYH